MIRGIGVDTVGIARFEHQLERTPRLRERLFAPAERELPPPSLAARFAAKEALIQALGGSGDLRWADLEVMRDQDRAPGFVPTPGLAAALGLRGADRVHLSMTHDADHATAFVIIESAGAVPAEASAGGFPSEAAQDGDTLAVPADEDGTGPR